jgi:nucleoid-associated protein YgaU
MGFFDFVKEAGEKILGGGKAQAAPAPAPTPEAKPQADREAAAALVKLITGLGFEVDDLGVKVVDGTATLTGKAASQGDKEKVVLAVGNVRGIGRVDDRMTVAKAEPEATFYTVKSGDTLSKIAREHYGNAGKYPVIFEANKPMLSDPNKIYPGQVLRIPPQPSA